jgi:hypothetical protein
MKIYHKISFLTLVFCICNVFGLMAQYSGGQGRGDVRKMNYATPSGANILTLDSINGPICAGTVFNVIFYNVGLYDINNVYTLELSDENGQFINPTVVGTYLGNENNDTIIASLPSNLVSGSNYLLRLNSSSPLAIGLNSNPIVINELLTPQISITTNQISSCQGTTLFFSSTVLNEGSSPSYQWMVNGNAVGVNNPNFSSFNLNDGDYISCQLTSSEACVTQASVTSDSIAVTILPLITTSVSISASQTTFCTGSNISFNANATNGGLNPVFQWYVNNTPTLIGSNFVTSSLNDLDTIHCVMISSLSCVTPALSNQIIVSVTPNNFGTTFTPSTTLLDAYPYILTFNNVAPQSAPYILEWAFGDGSTEVATSPSHTYISNGFYSVSLIATDTTTGCAQTYTYPTQIQVTGSLADCNFNVNLNQSGNISACIGGHVELSAITNAANPSFQWTINGVNIGGATQSSYNAIASGNYALIVYENGACPKISNVIEITFTNPTPPIPVITVTGSIQSCGQGSVTLETNAPGATNYLWNTGDTNNQISTGQSGNYYVTAFYSVGCQATSLPYNISATGAINPGICMVSVDSATNKNLIIWEVPVVNNIDSFYVYRETDQVNIYEKIGAVDYLDLSEFIDTGSYPAMKSYRYKIAVLDTCGGITTLSDFHKTIHLQIFPGAGNSRQLSWNNYEGINVPTYEIYRKFPLQNYQLLTTIAGNLNTYTDLNPTQPNADYRVEIVLPQNCNSSDRATYGKSKSNVGSNQGLLPGQIDPVNITSPGSIGSLAVYPNPSNGNITLEFESNKSEALSVKLINMLGEEVFMKIYQTGIGKNKFKIETNVVPGIYMLVVTNNYDVNKQIKFFVK